MAGEVMLINPRRRRRGRRRKTHARRARSHRRRRNPFFYNPRRRRRSRRKVARRRHRRVHRNPGMRMGKFFGINIGQAVTGAVGFVGTNVLANQLAKVIPPEWQSGAAAPVVRVGVKVAAVVGGAMALKALRQPALANAWALGGGIAIAVDLASSYLLPALGLSDYESGVLTGLADYESGMLTGVDNMYESGIYG